MIEVRDLVKNYGTAKAVKGVSFSVQKGEILGFLGPNAAGKTTVMKILTCFLPATSGSASVAGFDCETQAYEVRRRLGYLPENNPLYLDMKVVEYLDFAAQAKGIPSADRKAALGRAMEETGISPVSGKLIAQLSKGFRQRVGLAQALVGNPEVLILDEPTVGLDPRQITDIRKLIKNLSGERTVILSTHILPEVSIVCDRVVIINKGLVVEQDTTAGLSKRLAKTDRVQISLRAGLEEAAGMLRALDKVKKVTLKGEEDGVASLEVESGKGTDLRAAIAAAVVKRNWDLLELRALGLGLEEIFLQLVTQEETGAAGREAGADETGTDETTEAEA